MYGGPTATAYFVREVRKSTWFTQIPVPLSRNAGTAQFGQEWSCSISRAGDYLLQTWLRVVLPTVDLVDKTVNPATEFMTIRWCKNLMHNLIRECTITFNDLVAARFDNYHLDFWSAFTVPASKRNGYDNMIGNLSALFSGATTAENPLPSVALNLPLPFFFSRDTGVALPTAALPYNEMQINFSFRKWEELLVINTTKDTVVGNKYIQTTASLLKEVPMLSSVQVWGNYAIVSNEERRRMGCGVRDILIEQVQTAPRQNFTPATNNNPTYDIRFSHAIKALFFGVRNTTHNSEWSNYATNSPVAADNNLNYSVKTSYDPLEMVSLIYENTNRLGNMPVDYFSLVNPYFSAPAIPVETGYHMYSYSLRFCDLDPMGSTNYGKLTNVSLVPTGSAAAKRGAEGKGVVGQGADFNQTFEFIVTAVNNNIIRISGGALGFPVL
jgi:hypothetical protein